MKSIYVSLVLILLANHLISQKNIGGIYEDEYHSHTLDIKANNTFIYTWHSPCGVTPNNTHIGKWYNINDTIYLSIESDSIVGKYLYNYKFSFKHKGKTYSDSIALFDITYVDSALTNQWNDLRDLLLILTKGTRYAKQKSYYNTGITEYSIESYAYLKRRVESYYYPNAQIKEVRQFYKNKKSGDWFYYESDGSLIKILRFRRNHLRKTINYK